MVVAAPLEVHRSPGGETTKQLQKEFRLQVLKQSNVATPTPSAWDAALAQLKRQDCETNDDCLRELAVTAGALYAIHASVEQDLTKTNVTAQARIVRRDGVLIEIGGQRVSKVELPKGKESFEAAAKTALSRLLASMKLGELPSTLPAAEPVKPVVQQEAPDAGVAVAQVEPQVVDAGIPPPPPLVVENAPTPPGKIAAYTLIGVGAAGVVVGGAFGIVALGDKDGITGVMNGNGNPSQVSTQQAVDRNATISAVSISIGVACAAAGAALYFLSPDADNHTVITAAPMPGGGAMVGIGGRFP
jgi:hypothetical protein